MKIKDFRDAMLGAAAATLGAALTTKGIQWVSDPVKRAGLKKKIKNVKKAISSKEGS